MKTINQAIKEFDNLQRDYSVKFTDKGRKQVRFPRWTTKFVLTALELEEGK